MFKLLYTNLAGPMGDINVSAGLVAQAGMVGIINPNATTGDPEVWLYTSGATTNGVNAPSGDTLVGIIDDQKTSSFSATVVGEVVASGQTALAHANIIASGNGATLAVASGTGNAPSTVSVTVSSLVNGTITVAGVAASAPVTVTYSYIIPGKAGDDTTLASGKCTIWLQEGEYATDVFETSNGVELSTYVVGAPLYVADNLYGMAGWLTTRSVDGVKVAVITKAPTAGNPVINFFKRGIV